MSIGNSYRKLELLWVQVLEPSSINVMRATAEPKLIRADSTSHYSVGLFVGVGFCSVYVCICLAVHSATVPASLCVPCCASMWSGRCLIFWPNNFSPSWCAAPWLFSPSMLHILHSLDWFPKGVRFLPERTGYCSSLPLEATARTSCPVGQLP